VRQTSGTGTDVGVAFFTSTGVLAIAILHGTLDTNTASCWSRRPIIDADQFRRTLH
jgi:hypothetical protein